jgi:hypothetical protein
MKPLKSAALILRQRRLRLLKLPLKKSVYNMRRRCLPQRKQQKRRRLQELSEKAAAEEADEEQRLAVEKAAS